MVRISEEYLHYDGDGHSWLKASGASAPRQAEYRLADEHFANEFSRTLPPALADLVDLAMSVYLADRVVRRRPPGLDPYEFGWKRRLTLELPVRLLERWRRPEIEEALRRCLAFLTEDDWEFVFVRREREGRTSERQQFLVRSELTPPVQVGLFSGGLDSLAGAGASLADSSAGSLVLLSGSTHSRLKTTIAALAQDARAAAMRDFRTLVLPFGLHQSSAQYNTNERSQRSRGFLYGTLGAVAAMMAGGQDVLVYENGVGAINLPYSPAQLGTHSTRSTNPIALSYLADFLRLFTEQPIEFRLPNLLSTKAEMCARLATSRVRASIQTSISCDSFPLRNARAAQCGVCTSCLLRRQALWAAGLEQDDPGELYFYDVISPPGDLKDARWHPLRDMLGQVDTFRRALASQRPWDALAGEFPMVKQVAWNLEDRRLANSSREAQSQLMSLIGRYCAEWEQFPPRPPGWRFGTPDTTSDWRLRHAC